MCWDFMKLSDEMNDEIPYLCHLLLASGGFLCLPAATMYQYYWCCVLYLCVILLCIYGSMINNSEASPYVWILYYVEVHYNMMSVCWWWWDEVVIQMNMRWEEQVSLYTAQVTWRHQSFPAQLQPAVHWLLHQAEAVCTKPCIFMSEVSGSVGQ